MNILQRLAEYRGPWSHGRDFFSLCLLIARDSSSNSHIELKFHVQIGTGVDFFSPHIHLFKPVRPLVGALFCSKAKKQR